MSKGATIALVIVGVSAGGLLLWAYERSKSSKAAPGGVTGQISALFGIGKTVTTGATGIATGLVGGAGGVVQTAVGIPLGVAEQVVDTTGHILGKLNPFSW